MKCALVRFPTYATGSSLAEIVNVENTNRGEKTRHWLKRYHFVVSTLALGLKINFYQPIKWMEFQADGGKMADN